MIDFLLLQLKACYFHRKHKFSTNYLHQQEKGFRQNDELALITFS